MVTRGYMDLRERVEEYDSQHDWTVFADRLLTHPGKAGARVLWACVLCTLLGLTAAFVALHYSDSAEASADATSAAADAAAQAAAASRLGVDVVGAVAAAARADPVYVIMALIPPLLFLWLLAILVLPSAVLRLQLRALCCCGREHRTHTLHCSLVAPPFRQSAPRVSQVAPSDDRPALVVPACFTRTRTAHWAEAARPVAEAKGDK